MVPCLKKGIARFIKDESGDAVLIMFVTLIVPMFLCFGLILNIMLWGAEVNSTQVAADSASRAGTLATYTIYAMKEKNYGSDAYHVYVELNPELAQEYTEKVLDMYDAKTKHTKILEREFNPYGFTVPVWDYETSRWYNKYLTSDKQYQNGNNSVRLRSSVKTIWNRLFGLPEEIEYDTYSQSTARAGIKRIY